MDEDSAIKEIAAKTGKTHDEISKLVEEKELEFSGMISRIGAAYLVGRELGVELMKPTSSSLKIKNIVAGLSRVSFAGKVVQISPVREFDTEKGKGKVANLMLADDSGTIRLALWNEKTELLEGEDKISVGDVLEINGAYTRKDNLGRADLQLGRYGSIKRNNSIKMDSVSAGAMPRQTAEYKDALLDSISENDFIRVRATVLQVFERKLIYRTCSVCREKLEGMICEKHKDAKPEKLLIVSTVIDDGTSPINAVFFRDAAENLLGKSVEDIEQMILTKGEGALWKSVNVAGHDYILSGIVRRNDVMDRLELVVHSIKPVNVLSECNKLLAEMNA